MSKKPIRSQARNVVYNVYQRICAEEDGGQSKSSILMGVQTFTRVSSSTIRRIINEGRVNGGVFYTPGKKRKGGKKKNNLESFDLEVIRNKIKEFYTVRKEIPTVRKLLQTLRKDIDFNGGRESLRLILKNIGFEFVKCQSKRTILMVRHDIKIQRFRYLERMKKNRESQEPNKLDVVYLEETYIHGSCSVNKCWQSKDLAGPYKSISARARWIIVNAGEENGFVPNFCLIYRSKSISADYHHDINQNSFKKWVTEKLLPNLRKPALIVMDNASYHSLQLNKPPTQADRIADIKEWLLKNNIDYGDRWCKSQLLEAVQQNKSTPIYEIDEILKSHGHEVLRLPPYHCTLNPIEMIWGIMKQKDAEKNINRPATDNKSLTEEAFSQIGADEWQKCCEHVIKHENDFIDQGRLIEKQEERFIINISVSSSSSSDEEEDMQVEYLEPFSSSE